MFKLDLEKAEEPEIKLPIFIWSWRKQEDSRKIIYFCFIDYTEAFDCVNQNSAKFLNRLEYQKNVYCFTDYAKAFDCVDHNKLWKILKEMGISDHLTCLLRNLYAGQVTEPDMEQLTGSNWERSMTRLYTVTLFT